MELIERLGAAVKERARPRVLVGVDGPDAAGKTMLADALADRLGRAVDGTVLRASIDGFHLPREARYRRGELSAEGYYRDSFDYPTLRTQCLEPFAAGDRSVRTAAYDYRSDADRDEHAVDVPPWAVLIVDGVFLLRPELRDLWSLSIYLRVSPAETLRRAAIRDLALFGSAEEIERRYHGRYLPGQELYRREADPEEAADVLVDNDRADAPTVLRWS